MNIVRDHRAITAIRMAEIRKTPAYKLRVARTRIKELEEELEQRKEQYATETTFYQDHVMHCSCCGGCYWDVDYTGDCPLCAIQILSKEQLINYLKDAQ